MNNKISKKDLIKLAKKYTLNTSGTKTQIAKRLSDLRGIYLTQTERKLIMPLLNKQHKNTKILKQLYKSKKTKKLPKS